MRTRQARQRRSGAAALEFAFVAPVVLTFVFAQMAGGIGISRYHELAYLARDCARFASTHGGMYKQEGTDLKTGVPAVTDSASLYKYLAARTVLLDPSKVKMTVSWTAPEGYSPSNMPTYVDTNPNLTPPGQHLIYNDVIVTLSYEWKPGVFGISPITLTSTSQMPMSY